MSQENEKVTAFFTQLAREFPRVQKILLFGSRARGDFHEKSDFDIAIFGKLDFQDKLKICEAVEEWHFVYKVDLIFFEDLQDKTMRQNIIKDGKVIMDKLEQKISNFQKALTRLEAVLNTKLDNDILLDATIQRFEFTTELAWKTMRAKLLDEGVSQDELSSPKQVIRAAFQAGLIDNGDNWFAMLEARNITSHVYDLEQAEAIVGEIKDSFIRELNDLSKKLETER